MLKEKILQKIDNLLSEARELHLDIQNHLSKESFESKTLAYRAFMMDFIEQVVGKNSHFYSSLSGYGTAYSWTMMTYYTDMLHQLRAYVDEGWVSGIRNLISAEIFDNFFEMAEYLQSEGYKDPAAVIAGSILESHLRDLCNNHGIPIFTIDSSGKTQPVKADKMNVGLVKSGTYNVLEQKSVTAWLDLRNKAAHGRYSEYDKSQVTNMLSGIRDFIVRNPA